MFNDDPGFEREWETVHLVHEHLSDALNVTPVESIRHPAPAAQLNPAGTIFAGKSGDPQHAVEHDIGGETEDRWEIGTQPPGAASLVPGCSSGLRNSPQRHSANPLVGPTGC